MTHISRIGPLVPTPGFGLRGGFETTSIQLDQNSVFDAYKFRNPLSWLRVKKTQMEEMEE
jgi:hypothetical protein